MMKPIKTKYWSMTLLNPTFEDLEKLERRGKRIQYCAFGVDWVNDQDMVLEAIMVFNERKTWECASRFFRKGNWNRTQDIVETTKWIKQYEWNRHYGTMPYESIQTNLFPDDEN